MDRFDFYQYAEKWATRYKPIGHKPSSPRPEDKRVYYINNWADVASFVVNLPNAPSPCILLVTDHEYDPSKGNPKLKLTSHKMFVMVRAEGTRVQNSASEEQPIITAKEQGVQICRDFLTCMAVDKKNTQAYPEMKSLILDSASIINQPGRFNAWYASEVIIEQYVGNGCKNEVDYYSDEELSKRGE